MLRAFNNIHKLMSKRKTATTTKRIAKKPKFEPAKNKKTAKTVPPVGPPNDFVYLLQEREFIKTQEPIFKIGKTTQTPNARLRGYPNQSRVILYIDVSAAGCHAVEDSLIAEFDKLYIHRADIGREYYEGDLEKMKSTFFRIVTTAQEDALRPGMLWRTCTAVWRVVSWGWNSHSSP